LTSKIEKQRRSLQVVKDRVSRIKDLRDPERRMKREAILDQIKIEVMQEFGLEYGIDEGELSSGLIGTMAQIVKERFNVVRGDIFK
jgi:hypothetical protein